MNNINEYSSQYMDTFESPQDEYTRSDEFKKEFYSNLKKCLNERDYMIVTQIINGSSYEQVGEELGLSPQNVKNKFNDVIKRLSTNRYFKDIISALLRGEYTARHVSKIERDERQRSENQYRQQQLKKLSQDEWFNELKNRNYEDAKEYAYYKYGIKLESRNMDKKLIRLTESDLHRIVKESVKRILKEENFGGIPNMVGNHRTSKSHGCNSADRRKRNSADRRNRMMQKYNRFNDGSDNPYSDEGRYYCHLEKEPQGIGESKYYNPRTYERDESKEFTHDEIRKLVSILKENPIEEMWKPYDLGWCKVQRVEANQTSGRSYLLSDPHDMSSPQDMYSDGNNGTIYLQIGRMPNTHWLDESGYTYMCWKW